jgi:hypothetical protein
MIKITEQQREGEEREAASYLVRKGWGQSCNVIFL